MDGAGESVARDESFRQLANGSVVVNDENAMRRDRHVQTSGVCRFMHVRTTSRRRLGEIGLGNVAQMG